MPPRLSLSALTILAALALPPAAQASESSGILATIGMISDPAGRIGGGCVSVAALVGEGLDPHLYTPRPSDIARLRGAERVVALGLGLEGRLAEVLERSGALILGDRLDPTWLREENGATDPHLWMDAVLWSSIYPQLMDLFTEVSPECQAEFEARMFEEAQLAEALDGWIRASIASIPEGNRVLMTAHDAFGYYAAAYGLEAHAIQGLSTESEASIASIQSLARFAAERQVPAVFIESTLNPRAVEALIEASAALGHELARGGELFSDSLGPRGSGAETWPGMLVHNTRAIVGALGGTPAPLPEPVEALLAATAAE